MSLFGKQKTPPPAELPADSVAPAVTGEAAAIPAIADVAPAAEVAVDEVAVDEAAAPAPARVPVAVRCRECGFGWTTVLPLPTPCISCHRGYKDCAGHADPAPLVIR